jgi:hypothetical protein
MYMENTLQMEWCLNCHRNPAVNLRPTGEIYNMAWTGPSTDKPVWCAPTGKGASGTGPTAQSVACTTKDPSSSGNPEIAMLQAQAGFNPMQQHSIASAGQAASDGPPMGVLVPVSYRKFTSQIDLGRYLTSQYHIRPPNELTSCETCHR